MKQSSLFSKKLAALVAGGLFSLSLASPAAAAETRSLALAESVELALENNRTIKAAALRSPSRSTRAARSSTASRRRASA